MFQATAPLGFASGQTNFYARTGDDPAAAVDPSGLEVILIVERLGKEGGLKERVIGLVGHGALIAGPFDSVDEQGKPKQVWRYLSYGDNNEKGYKEEEFDTRKEALEHAVKEGFQAAVSLPSTTKQNEKIYSEFSEEIKKKYQLMKHNCIQTAVRIARSAGLAWPEVRPGERPERYLARLVNETTFGPKPPPNMGYVPSIDEYLHPRKAGPPAR